MKVSCSNTDLSFALNIVNKAISTHTTLPVLNNILLKAEGNKLFFSATNLEIAISYFIEADVKNEGKVTIPAKLFSNYASLLEVGEIQMSLEDGFSLNILSRNSKTKIKGISADEFPLFPKVEKDEGFFINKELFEKSIEKIVFAASTNVSRPSLTGVLLKVNKDLLTMVATDSYRLSEKKITLEKKLSREISSIVPAKTIFELGKILHSMDKEDKLEVIISKDQILFKIGNMELISRLIDGTFPDYEKVIPKNKETTVEIKVVDFISAVRKVSLFVTATNSSIKVNVTNDGKLLLVTDETQLGEVKASLDVKVEGKNNQIALNSLYLLDYLNNCDDDIIMMDLEDKATPAVFKTLKDGTFFHIVMPLKL